MKNSIKMIFGITSIVMINLNSCTVLKPGLVGQDTFQTNANEMKVIGRFGWTFNKSVKFGSFYTSKFNSGLIKINNDEPGGWHFDLFKSDYSNAQQRFSFKQFDSTGNSIELMCLAERSSKTIHYGKSLSGEDVLNDKYEIIIYQNNSEYTLIFPKELNSTSIISFEKDTFAITNDYKYDVKTKKIFTGIIIREKGETLAAVNLTNEGIVWIKNGLDTISKLRLAAISTAILLEPNLQNKK